MVGYIENYIQHNYNRSLDAQHIRYVSEITSYKYITNQISDIRGIVEYIDDYLNRFNQPLPF
jgi:hypothetical protein